MMTSDLVMILINVVMLVVSDRDSDIDTGVLEVKAMNHA